MKEWSTHDRDFYRAMIQSALGSLDEAATTIGDLMESKRLWEPDEILADADRGRPRTTCRLPAAP